MPLSDTAYTQLCESYRAIDDFRSKLLGFLPAITGASILLTSKESPKLLNEWSPAFGIFGGLITCGLFIYEIYGIRKCAALIHAGRELEISGQVHGQFCSRPQAVRGWINEPLAAAIIYPVVLASWWVVAFMRTLSGQKISLPILGVWVVPVLLIVGGFLGVRAYDRSLNKRDRSCCETCGRPL
jgi:hypothetical protein